MATSHYILMWILAVLVSTTLGNHHHHHGSKHKASSQSHQGADVHALTSVSEEIDGISHREKSTSKKGSDTKEDSSKSHEEKGGKTKKDFEEDYESGDHDDAHEGHLKAHYNNKKAQKNGKKEKGFRQSFRKREYHKVNKFFGDEHKGGAYNKFDAAKSKKNSQTFAQEAGKHHQQVAVEGKSKKP
ncbi:uncharacterized protein LOC129800272 [Phlebotomus papatasi]|uniref:uncharacterized protein LOC129800272 n=1 Tax=Phlebotomus papatasi TaxID=29031 RepID=UPI00248340A4|nr:uncharacterized protein LOC129800272 [Phlebotomus papatasi]